MFCLSSLRVDCGEVAGGGSSIPKYDIGHVFNHLKQLSRDKECVNMNDNASLSKHMCLVFLIQYP